MSWIVSMHTHWTTRLTTAAALTLSLSAFMSQAIADTLIIQGSSTLNRRLFERHQAEIEQASGHELTVIPSRTMLGLIALLEGRAHLAMISAPLKSEVATLQKAMPGLPYERLQAHEIAATRVAFGVHQSNPVRKASLEQLKGILTGKITNWSALGGKDQPIRVAAVGGGGGVIGTVEATLLDGQRVSAPNVLYVKTAVQLVQVVEQEPNILGIGQISLVRQRGIPEIATERPIEQSLAFVTLGDPTPAMKAVIDAARQAAGKML
jgi:phosphate transport system substrate-binding protein